MGFFRPEYWNGLPCLPPGDLPNPGIETRSPALWVDSLLSEPLEKPKRCSWYLFLALINEPSWLSEGLPARGDLGLHASFILQLHYLPCEDFKAVVFVCINPERGRRDLGSSHLGSVNRPAIDMVPIIPTPLPSAGTLLHGTPLSKKGGNVDVCPSSRESGLGALWAPISVTGWLIHMFGQLWRGGNGCLEWVVEGDFETVHTLKERIWRITLFVL